jgi:mannose-6-phosphate isomerase
MAARFCVQTFGDDFKIQDSEFYYEMWFGDYPNIPAPKLGNGELLREVLNANKEQLLGKRFIGKFDIQLPYILITGINYLRYITRGTLNHWHQFPDPTHWKALPLQLQLNKELVTQLHKENPETFTHPNHKPEIAVTLFRFEVFAGFRPLSQIEPLFRLHPLRWVVLDNTSGWSDRTLAVVEQVHKLLFQTNSDGLGMRRTSCICCRDQTLVDLWHYRVWTF